MTVTIKRLAAHIAPAFTLYPLCIEAALILAGCSIDGSGGNFGDSKNAAIYLWEGSFKDGKLDKDKTQWFKFNADEAGTYYVHVIFGTLESIYLRVYNHNGSPVSGRETLRKSQPNWYIPCEIPTGSRYYYIEVEPRYSGDSGTFKITYNKSTTPP